MNRIWFTSDTHFGQTNIVGKKLSKWESGYRTFESIDEMDTHILNVINHFVDIDDTLYHLGDFDFYKDITKTLELRKRILCKNVHMLVGNHDYAVEKAPHLAKRIFSSVNYIDRFTIKFPLEGTDPHRDKWEGMQPVTLSHYPFASWPRAGKGAWMLHGHCHGNLPEFKVNTGSSVKTIRRFDVGVDNIKQLFDEYRPISFEELQIIMKDRALGSEESKRH